MHNEEMRGRYLMNKDVVDNILIWDCNSIKSSLKLTAVTYLDTRWEITIRSRLTLSSWAYRHKRLPRDGFAKLD